MQESAETSRLRLLEARLKRVEYVVGGYQNNVNGRDSKATASQSLSELEHALEHITSRSKVSQDLVNLYAKYPELFQGDNPNDVANQSVSEEVSSTRLPIVLSAASSFAMTASSLTSIMDMPIPDPGASANITQTIPAVSKLDLLQDFQAREVMLLKQRSISILQRYYTLDILKTGEYWTDVEGRIDIIERAVKRAEKLKSQDELMV